ncbi:hypothetical protein HZY97_01705 [Sphingomonas sp. R-74633]|uniref:hypothetical protein n=1 Tax=Sphingomonas sp. R-74633 TaxID=2751188 RepID=UPI0015D25A68|nr:hypothetical protein [Sphingomonas sp. R-74633]NYT39458.1 hypothetical protein [Sphingomonas sp. R-74633]
MKPRALSLCLLILAGCGQGNGKATDEIIGHRWARTLAECDDSYLDFSRNMIDFVRDGRPVNSLAVLRIDSDPADSSIATFVIEGARGASDAAMVFKVDGDSLKLVGQGSLDALQRVAEGTRGNRSFVMRRCPA